MGRAVRVKRRFEDKLAQIDTRTKEIASTSETATQDTAVLLEAVDRALKEIGSSEQSLRAIAERVAALAARLDTLDANERFMLQQVDAITEMLDSVTRALDAHDHASADRLDAHDHASADRLDAHDHASADRLDVVRERLEAAAGSDGNAASSHMALLELIRRAPRGLEWRLVNPGTAAEMSVADTAELHLLPYLASLTSDRHAIDVGAHRGVYTSALIDQGMTVLGVEPNPPLAAALRERFAGNDDVVVVESAAGNRSGSDELYVARDLTDQRAFGDATLFSTLGRRTGINGLRFEAGPKVETKTVDEMRRHLGWPDEIGLIKIDVEGRELDVLDGLGETRPEILMCEYWGPDYMLVGDLPTPGPRAMADRLLGFGFRRWIALVHDADGQVSFAVNSRDLPPGSWGNMLGFKDRDTFLAATRWCAASLPELIRSVQET